MLISGMDSIGNGVFWVMDEMDKGIDNLRKSEGNFFSRAIGEGLWVASWVYGGRETKGLRNSRAIEREVEEALSKIKPCKNATLADAKRYIILGQVSRGRKNKIWCHFPRNSMMPTIAG